MTIPAHHPIFEKFNLTPTTKDNAGNFVDFLGVKTKPEWSIVSLSPAALPVDMKKLQEMCAGLRISCYEQETGLPHRMTEEYFEYIDILGAVEAAQNKFTFVDLGSGWGHWSLIAHHACKRRKRIPPVTPQILSVEPSPGRAEVIKQNYVFNGVSQSSAFAINCGVACDVDKPHFMPVGETLEGLAASITSSPDIANFFATFPMAKEFHSEFSGKPQPFIEIATVNLETILSPFDEIDLIDWDIQGLELDVIKANRELLLRKVKRMHVSTHRSFIDSELLEIFTADGWKVNYSYPCNTVSDTPFGSIMFDDGRISVERPGL